MVKDYNHATPLSSPKWIFGAGFLFCLLSYQVHCQIPKLVELKINPNTVSVSGCSSGAGMATQFHCAHSGEIFGAGIFAGAPYMCSGSNGLRAPTCMKTPNLVNVSILITETTALEKAGTIDPTSNINGDKVYIFHGSNDIIVDPGYGRKIQEMYDHYNADIKTEFNIPAGHGQPTDNYGGRCNAVSPFTAYINNCNYNGAFEMLNHVYGPGLVRPNAMTKAAGNFQLFDQSEFFDNNSHRLSASMDSEGFLYVPTACISGNKTQQQCSLHIVFHGCSQNRGLVKDRFAKNAQYLEVAELNNIVLLFPQTILSFIKPTNTLGCWDWWGYTGVDFPTKSGLQIKAVHRMKQRLIGREST